MPREWTQEDYQLDAQAREWSSLAQEIMQTEGVSAAEATRRASAMFASLKTFAERWAATVAARGNRNAAR